MQYEDLFDAILFAVYFCGCKPRCALEIDNGAQIRMDKIYAIIGECDLGIHDISRTEVNENNLPRFNMPFEFGIFMGARRFGNGKQKRKSCIIFDVEKFRYTQFISDISGQDIKAHGNNHDKIIREIRNWLNTFDFLQPLIGATAIIDNYNDYLIDKPKILRILKLTSDDVQYSDKLQVIEKWIILNANRIQPLN